jgi:hypothetical protein
MKTRTKIILGLSVLMLIAAGYGYYQYTRKNPDLLGASADISILATNLQSEYGMDEDQANKKYLNKIIQVRGKVRQIETDSTGTVTLSLETSDPISSVSCQLDKRHADQASKSKEGDTVSLTGLCTGMLTDVVLVRCAIDE